MYPDSDLEMLMARYQQGDFAAATALIHRLSPQLHRFFVVQFASRGDADDLLQETWLRIHQVRHTYRAGEPVLAWVYAIARRIRVDHYRKACRTAGREEPLERMPEPAAAPPSGAEQGCGPGNDFGPPSGEPARGDRDVEGGGNVAGGGGARHFVERGVGETEGASGLRASAGTAGRRGTGQRGLP